ncbi:MAG: ankyrin repeat domain-containing protein [Candidatus Omnitrophota bacterium]
MKLCKFVVMVMIMFFIGIQSGYCQDAGAFISAAHNGDLAVMESYLDNGGDINAVDYTGATALHIAIGGIKTEMVKFLIDKGANLNIGDGMNYTPLHGALCKNEEYATKYVKMLLDKGGVDVNVQTIPEKHSPLMFAADSGYLEIVKLLVDKGADVNLKDSSGKTALDRARKSGENEVAEFLLLQRTDDPQKKAMIENRMNRRGQR